MQFRFLQLGCLLRPIISFSLYQIFIYWSKMCLNFFELYNLPPGSEIIRENYYITASLSFLGGGWGRRPIWLGKMVSSVLCSRVKRRIILVECNLIVNFYHVLEAVIRLHFRTILISLFRCLYYTQCRCSSENDPGNSGRR